jgi:hypothetical protein
VIGSALVYAGLVVFGVGIASLVHPLRWLGVAGRGNGALFLAALGATLLLIGIVLPAPFIRIADEPMHLDDFVPAYQFAEAHEARVRAPADRVYHAIQQVTANEIRFFRLLTWIRAPHIPGRGPESILNAPGEQPLLSVALRSGFMLLVEEPGREIVVGTIVCCGPPPRGLTPEGFRALDEPGYAKAAMNFRVTDAGGGWTRLTTQTRVVATDATARRRFAIYWRAIYPGSALIRRMWLAAIARRAESQ